MKTVLSFFLFLITSLSYATGPSYVRSQLIPIALNDRGELLCKTRYEENGMGAHAAIRVVFGFCVITKDTLISYPDVVLDPNDYDYDDEKFFNQLDFWDNIYTSATSERRLKSIVTDVLQGAYRFDQCNGEDYRKEKTYSLDQFKESYGIDLTKQRQTGLRGATSRSYQQGRVKLLYKLGNIFIFDNYHTYEEEEGYGAFFNYNNPFMDYDEEQEYDVYYVNGFVVKEQ